MPTPCRGPVQQGKSCAAGAARTTAALSPHAIGRLVEYLESLTLPRLLHELRTADDAALRRLWDAIGVHDCDCPIKRLPCGCDAQRAEKRCDCRAVVEPCRHARQEPLYVWPAEAAAYVLARLWPADYDEPPPPGSPCIALSQQATAAVMDSRQGRGEGLRHAGDLSPRDLERCPELARLVRQVGRRRNGSVEVGRLVATLPMPPAPAMPAAAPVCLIGVTLAELTAARIAHAA